MKTLRQYVVNGGLYAGDGKTPAAVGDQVRLYLDTEAHADFPEYIIGTIQHPVAPILAGTAISYSFEYDETDLDDVVANLIVADVISVEVYSAVDVVAEKLDDHIGSGGTAHINVIAAGAAGFMTGADKTKLDAITGTNTGDETTESVLALLANSDLEVASIGLSDGTGTALDPGRLTLNANGDPVVHDNQSNAEDLPFLVNSLDSLNFATRVLAASMDNVSFSRKVADIPLPSSALTNGKQLFISGKTFAIWSTGNKPDAGAFLVLCKEGQDPEASGMIFNFAEGGTTEERSFSLALSFSVVSSTWTLAAQNAIASAIIRKNSAGTITHAAGWAFGTDWVNVELITGAAGEPVKLEIHLVSFDASDTVAANLFASGQLSVIHE